MIEQGIYFALGCIVTALAALAFAPFFWRRALRLTRARLQLQVPLSMQEILAERDQLRAEYAVERLRAEHAMERVRAGKTRDMAVIGRQRMAAATAADEMALLKRLEQSQDKEIHHLVSELTASTTESGALQVELHDSHALIERWRSFVDRAAEARAAMRHDLENKRTLIASLETRVSGLEMRLTDSQRGGVLREQGLLGRLEAAMAQSARHETSGLSLRREVDEARLRIHALEHELEGAAVGAREREKNANLLLSLQNGKARGLDRTHAETVDSLKAENEVLRDALTEARRTMPSIRSAEDADGGLRESIHSLGLAVARMSRSGWEQTDLKPADRDRSHSSSTPTPIDAA